MAGGDAFLADGGGADGGGAGGGRAAAGAIAVDGLLGLLDTLATPAVAAGAAAGTGEAPRTVGALPTTPSESGPTRWTGDVTTPDATGMGTPVASIGGSAGAAADVGTDSARALERPRITTVPTMRTTAATHNTTASARLTATRLTRMSSGQQHRARARRPHP